jgi:hypothetical protein
MLVAVVTWVPLSFRMASGCARTTRVTSAWVGEGIQAQSLATSVRLRAKLAGGTVPAQ